MSRFKISAQAIKKNEKNDSRESLESERFNVVKCVQKVIEKPDLKLTNYYLAKGQVKFHRNAYFLSRLLINS